MSLLNRIAPKPGQAPGFLDNTSIGMANGTIDARERAPGAMGETDWNKELGKDNPLPQQAYLDPTVANDLVPAQLSRDEKYFGDTLNYGVDDKAGLVSSNDPMAKALASKYEGEVSNSLRSIKDANKAQAPVLAQEQQGTAAKELGTDYAIQVQNFNEQYAYQVKRQQLLTQWQQAKDAAKQGLFGAIFSGLGAVGGAILGGVVGGPGGAVAGAMAGGNAGKAAGGGR